MSGNKNKFLTFDQVLQLLEEKQLKAVNHLSKVVSPRAARKHGRSDEFLKALPKFLLIFKEEIFEDEIFLYIPSRRAYLSYKNKARELFFDTEVISLLRKEDGSFIIHWVSNDML